MCRKLTIEINRNVTIQVVNKTTASYFLHIHSLKGPSIVWKPIYLCPLKCFSFMHNQSMKNNPKLYILCLWRG